MAAGAGARSGRVALGPDDSALERILDALAESLIGVYPELEVRAAGLPDCALVALVRPTASDEPHPEGGRCMRQVRGVVGLYAMVDRCGLEEAQRHIYRMTSGCGPGSVLARLRQQPLAPLREAGAGLESVGPAGGYQLTRLQTEGPPNAYHASIPWVASYPRC